MHIKFKCLTGVDATKGTKSAAEDHDMSLGKIRAAARPVTPPCCVVIATLRRLITYGANVSRILLPVQNCVEVVVLGNALINGACVKYHLEEKRHLAAIKTADNRTPMSEYAE